MSKVSIDSDFRHWTLDFAAVIFYSLFKKNQEIKIFMPIELDDRAKALEDEYFHRREKELIENMRTRLASENSNATERDCPKCDGKLVETDYENIKIDVCNSCHGVWLDAGEMALILHKDESASGSWFGRLFSAK
jgi:hypothetical protein